MYTHTHTLTHTQNRTNLNTTIYRDDTGVGEGEATKTAFKLRNHERFCPLQVEVSVTLILQCTWQLSKPNLTGLKIHSRWSVPDGETQNLTQSPLCDKVMCNLIQSAVNTSVVGYNFPFLLMSCFGTFGTFWGCRSPTYLILDFLMDRFKQWKESWKMT